MKSRTFLAFVALLVLAVVPISSAPPPADPVAELAEARLKAAQEAYRQFVAFWGEHDRRLEAENRYVWSKHILEAQQETAKNKEEIVAACQAHLDRMLELQKLVRAMDPAAFRSTPQIPKVVEFYRAEADLWLARAKAKK